MKLHQLLAIIKKVKNQTKKSQTEIYHQVQKNSLFDGLLRKFTPVDDEGYVYPGESKKIVYAVSDRINSYINETIGFIDLCYKQDSTNQVAQGELIINGNIIKNIPVTFLLFLESELNNLKAFISALPTLEVAENWTFDTNRDCFVSEVKSTAKTKKISKPVVFYEATDKHPAQVKEVSEDIVEGTWETLLFSAALPFKEKEKYLYRVDSLIKQVIMAREKANETEVIEKEIARDLLNSVFLP